MAMLKLSQKGHRGMGGQKNAVPKVVDTKDGPCEVMGRPDLKMEEARSTLQFKQMVVLAFTGVLCGGHHAYPQIQAAAQSNGQTWWSGLPFSSSSWQIQPSPGTSSQRLCLPIDSRGSSKQWIDLVHPEKGRLKILGEVQVYWPLSNAFDTCGVLG